MIVLASTFSAKRVVEQRGTHHRRRSASEETTYVRNIVKYYIANKLMLDVQSAKKLAHEEVKQGS
ncbi:MAG: hypothetical protein KC588_16020 [Nitrospira sp.]|nr:hypothetical protein [Nitrospira sp.]